MNSLLIHEPPLQVLPSLATEIGLNEALFLQQLHYWIQKSDNVRDGRRWVYNTYDAWQEQFPFWSVSTVRRIIKKLRKQDIVETTDEYNKLSLDNTLWYTIKYENVPSVEIDRPSSQPDQSTSSSCASISGQVDQANNQRLPETTTERDSPPPENPWTENQTTDDLEHKLNGSRNRFYAKRNGKPTYSRQEKPYQWNAEVPARERVPLVDAIGQRTGKRVLADAGDDATLAALHNAAILAYKMGYTEPATLDPLDDIWREDYRSNAPTVKQYLDFLSENRTTMERKKDAPPVKVKVIEGDM